MTNASPGVTRLVNGIIQREGGYVDHPNDRGGPTCWGITEKVARAHGYKGAMRDLPRDLAFEIYVNRYYVEPGFDKIDALSREVAEELTDTGVNMGQQAAAKLLQRALNALNRAGKDYPDVAPDGDAGAKTRDALSAYLSKRGREGVRVLLTALNCLQGARYIEIAENSPSQESFVYGWLRERVVIPTTH